MPPGMAEKQIVLGKTFATFKVPEGTDLFNVRAGHAAEVPSANLISNARSLAKIGAAIANHGTLDGVEILSKETLDAASVPLETLDDGALPLPPTPFSTGGWALWHGGVFSPPRFFQIRLKLSHSLSFLWLSSLGFIRGASSIRLSPLPFTQE